MIRIAQKGFTLLELLVVLGIIGTMAAVILPNIGLSPASAMSTALREFAATARGTYDAAILSSTVHRLVIKPKTGEYWAEKAPLGFAGRPPVFLADGPSAASALSAQEDNRKRLLEELEQDASHERKMKSDDKRNYSVRSILVQRRKVFAPIKWSEVDDAVLYKHKLPGAVFFSSSFVEGMRDPLDFAQAGENDTISIYFFPSGAAMQASLQLGSLLDGKAAENGPKYTIVLDPLTGQSELLEGFQDAEFVKAKKSL